MPSDIGFAVPGEDGRIVIGLADGIRWLDPESGAVSEPSPGPVLTPGHRLNDGKSDRAGRLWFGSIREDAAEATAALYRCDGRTIDVVRAGITASNGLGWSPEGDRMYYADSPTHAIVAFDADPTSGAISAPADFAVDPSSWTPDGLTVDSEGFVWSAKWDGGRVVWYAPDGTPVLTMELPVRRPTSCMFVGPNLDLLAVTSARSEDDDHEGRRLAGSVFLVSTDVQGVAERPLSFGFEGGLPLSPTRGGRGDRYGGHHGRDRPGGRRPSGRRGSVRCGGRRDGSMPGGPACTGTARLDRRRDRARQRIAAHCRRRPVAARPPHRHRARPPANSPVTGHDGCSGKAGRGVNQAARAGSPPFQRPLWTCGLSCSAAISRTRRRTANQPTTSTAAMTGRQ